MKYPEFDIPDGVMPFPPDGAAFQRQATFKIGKSGKLILLAVDGYPLIQPPGPANSVVGMRSLSEAYPVR